MKISSIDSDNDEKDKQKTMAMKMRRRGNGGGEYGNTTTERRRRRGVEDPSGGILSICEGGGVFDCGEACSPRERQVARARAGGGVGGRGGVMHGKEVVNSAYEVY